MTGRQRFPSKATVPVGDRATAAVHVAGGLSCLCLLLVTTLAVIPSSFAMPASPHPFEELNAATGETTGLMYIR